MKRRWLWCLSVLVACSGSSGDEGASDVPHEASTDADTMSGETAQTLPGDPDLSGAWALVQEMSGIAEVPMVGQVVRTNRSYAWAVVTGGQGSFDLEATACAVEIDSGTDLVQLLLPDQTIEHLNPVQHHLTVTMQDGTVHTEGEESIDLRGVRLDDPSAEALPTTADDPRVYDQDNDNRPGITVQATGVVDGQIWVVQRMRSRFLDGRVTVGGVFGLVEWTDEQVPLGADNELLLMTDNSSTPNPDPTTSWFRMVRMNGVSDCAGLMANRGLLDEGR